MKRKRNPEEELETLPPFKRLKNRVPRNLTPGREKEVRLGVWGCDNKGNTLVIQRNGFSRRYHTIRSTRLPNFDLSTYRMLKSRTVVIKDKNGRIYSFGYGDGGALGVGGTESFAHLQLIAALKERVVTEACGSWVDERNGVWKSHTLLLTDDGKTIGCGDNVFLQAIGKKIPSSSTISSPQRVVNVHRMSGIACGLRFSVGYNSKSLAITCWGSNKWGELGCGENQGRDPQGPIQVVGELVNESTLERICCGAQFSLALTTFMGVGRVWSWGSYRFAQVWFLFCLDMLIFTSSLVILLIF